MAKNPKFGPFWAQIAHFWAKTFFFRKSENVTFLDLLKANLMQKIRKKLMDGLTDGAGFKRTRKPVSTQVLIPTNDIDFCYQKIPHSGNSWL